MISNSKSFVIQAFIVLTILASSLTSFVYAAAISPAHPARVMGSLLPRIDAGDAMVNLCSALSSTITGACNGASNTPEISDCGRIKDGLTVICSESNGSNDAIANADANTLLNDIANGNTLKAIQDICNTLQLDIGNICNNFNDSADNAFCSMLASSVSATCQMIISQDA